MEVKLLCAAVLLVSTLTGIGAQLNVCGVAPLNTKIVGGQDAAQGAWPWQVSVESVYLCGGSLINNQWVLTAAQCFRSSSPVGVRVYLGRHTQSGSNPNEQSRTVSQIILHPAYSSYGLNHDIALVKLSSPVTFNNYIRPVCLAAADSVFKDGKKVWVTGWGDLRTSSPLPPNKPLQEVQLPIVSNSECRKIYGSGVTDKMICAGASGGKDICNGDSGGPLVTTNGSRWIQGGVTIFGNAEGCAMPKSPSGFTRVSEYESWIKSQITTNQPGFITAASSSVGPATGVFLTVLLSLYLLS